MVELIIVIAIICILASIIMPKMGGARGKAKLAACKTNLRHIGLAMEMYANDNRGTLYPPALFVGGLANFPINDLYGPDYPYLITLGYLKYNPICPHVGSPAYWGWFNGSTGFVYCATDISHNAHPGLEENFPRYRFDQGVVDR